MKRIIIFLLIFLVAFSFILPPQVVLALEDEIIDQTDLADSSTESESSANIDQVDDNQPPSSTVNDELKQTVNYEEPIDKTPSSLLPQETSSTITVTPPAPTYEPPKRDLVVTAFQTTNALAFVELYNGGSKTLNLSGWKILAQFYNDDLVCEIPIDGYVLPKSRVLMKQNELLPEAVNAHIYTCGGPSRVVSELSIYDESERVEQLIPPSGDTQIWRRRNVTATYLTGDFTKDFEVFVDSKHTITDGFWYLSPPDPELTILEVLVNPSSCVVPDNSPDCYDYIKVRNDGTKPVDLADYRLRSGYINSQSSTSNTAYFSDILQPGETYTLQYDSSGERLSLTANDGTVWFEDVEGVVVYPTNVPPYIGSDLTSKKGLSWAFDPSDAAWKWAIPSPGMIGNRFLKIASKTNSELADDALGPCPVGQYRNPETNRCRKIETEPTLTPCKEGQYRSEETNRCRSIATAAASVLKPCADGQFRNPETNRCKKIASADDIALADCGEGRERNPMTNRCRNIMVSSVPEADFAIEPIKQTASALWGWWALGGVSLLAFGYAGWEWREEIVNILRKVKKFFYSNQ